MAGLEERSEGCRNLFIVIKYMYMQLLYAYKDIYVLYHLANFHWSDGNLKNPQKVAPSRKKGSLPWRRLQPSKWKTTQKLTDQTESFEPTQWQHLLSLTGTIRCRHAKRSRALLRPTQSRETARIMLGKVGPSHANARLTIVITCSSAAPIVSSSRQPGWKILL